MTKRITITVFILLAIILVNIKNTNAETAKELRDQISATNKQIELLDKEIAQYKNQIAETSEQANTLANLIKELNLTRSKLVTEKTQTEKKISSTNFAILELTDNITEQQRSINNSREILSTMIKELDQQDKESILEKILTKKSLTEMSREYNSIISVNENIRQYINDLEIQKLELGVSKDKKEEEHKNLTTLKNTLSQKEQAILVAKKEKDKVLAETKNQEAEYKRLLAESQKARDIFEKAIDDYEAKLEAVLNPKSIPTAKNGILSWPLDSILITSIFGERWGKFHSGVDFRASVGTSVMAMQDGEIIGVGDTDIDCKGASFGKWIFIKYSNGLSSVYGHLSSNLVKEGQKVKKGDVVALSGNTGYSTGPHLHVSVYASEGVKVDTVPSQSCAGKVFKQPMLTAQNARLDPLLYLPITTTTMFKK